MKKITLLFMVLLLGVGGVSATEHNLDIDALDGTIYDKNTHLLSFGEGWVESQWWYGNDNPLDISSYREFIVEYTGATSELTFRVYLEPVSGTTQTVYPKANKSFGRIVIKLASGLNNIKKIAITSANSEKFNMTLTRAYFRSKTNESSTSLWTGSHPLAWDNIEALTQDGPGKTALQSAKVGDVIKVTFTNTLSGNSINVRNSSYTDFIDGVFSGFAVQADAQSAEYVIPNAEVLESIQLHGIIVSGNNATVTNIDLLTYDESYDACMVTIGTDEIATFSTGSKKLDFSGTGITPYYASAVDSEQGQVTLTAIADKTTWGYRGYILKGAKGTYEIPATNGGTYIDEKTNFLKATGDYNADVAASTSGAFHYIFAKKKESSDEPGFYKLTAAHKLGAHKAYLETETDITPNNARVALVFSDEAETTGISASLGEKVEKASEHIYNLRGMRVTQPQKGLYIKNGKKMIIR